MSIILSILAIAISLVTIAIAMGRSMRAAGFVGLPPVPFRRQPLPPVPPATPPPPPPDTIAAYLPIEFPAHAGRWQCPSANDWWLDTSYTPSRWQRFWVRFFFGVTWQPYPPARLPLWGTDTTSQDAPCRPSASPEKTS
jgi:hypothetical protein